MVTQQFDVIVIGGGAAGLFCAIEAGKRRRKVLLLEHSDRVGKKILISGGGRCNFTNLHTSPEMFLSANPHFCKSALARYTPFDFISLVEKHGIAYHEKKLGQLFCDKSSRQIVDMLLNEAGNARMEILCSCKVNKIDKDDLFHLDTSHGQLISSSLVIATGGLSVAPLGASDFGYRIARQFGIVIQEPKPGLVPLTLHPDLLHRLSPLSGISIDTIVHCAGKQFHENTLITHRGLSGPAILQISSYWKNGEVLTLDLLPGTDVKLLLLSSRSSETELSTLLSQHLPRRFARSWCELYFVSKPLNQFPAREVEAIAQDLQHMQIIPSGTEGFRKAEVTVGGVSTGELSSKTMESKCVPGLYFVGEVVDVTGQLGGYNFQWAWASGFAAGQFV